MCYINLLKRCNNFSGYGFYDFLQGDDQRIGWVHDSHIMALRGFENGFVINDQARTLRFVEDLTTPADRTALMVKVGLKLREDGLLGPWRNEMYPVKRKWEDESLFDIERAMTPYFGIRAFGVHMNGFVRTNEGLKMWIAKRSMTKATSPGMWDNMVAGGQPVGLSLRENMIKECAEEAGVPAGLAGRVKQVGGVAYNMQVGANLKHDVLYCYDLELPVDFIPQNVDGEVDDFQLIGMTDLCTLLCETCEVKENRALVMLDFLLRHGVLNREKIKNFDWIKESLVTPA
ncbi:DUF4743 domain-containing protein [Terasakiella pusilla]|uniref:DUF4743 domain-containing protein n=1 Tax=Terasakiella pusilla TaxID=64973 RepID=UPI003AA8A4A4